MRNSLVVSTAILIAFVCTQDAGAQTRSVLDGVWNYINPGRAGQSFFLNGHFIHFSYRADVPIPDTGNVPDSTRLRLFNTMVAISGTFTVSDTIVSAVTEFNKIPLKTPSPWRWSFSLKGDTCTYHVLNDKGQWTSTGRAVRIGTLK